MAEERIPFTKITKFSDAERNLPTSVINVKYPLQKKITLEGSNFEQRIYGIDIITPDEVIRTIDVSIWDGVSTYLVTDVVPAPMGTPFVPTTINQIHYKSLLKQTDSIAKIKVIAASGTFNNWKKANVTTPYIPGVGFDMTNKKVFYKTECKKPFSLFETTQFSMLVNRIDEMGVPYISIPKGHSLLIAFITQSSVTTNTKGVSVVVTGEKVPSFTL